MTFKTRPERIASLTRTQREALDTLIRTGHQWPLSGRPGGVGDDHSTHCRYSRRTLDALVEAREARWVVRHGSGVMPHVALGPTAHQCASWQLLDSAHGPGLKYCAACGNTQPNPQWKR